MFGAFHDSKRSINRAKWSGPKVEISIREIWTNFHGMILGALFLLSFGGAIAELYDLRPAWLTETGSTAVTRRLKWGLWSMALLAWLTVISGTWLIYIWYRAKPVAGANLSEFPRYFLLSKPETEKWHSFAMEWKEHITWMAPLILTSVAYTVQYYGQQLRELPRFRKVLLCLLAIGFLTAAVGGVFGALINKFAATR
jgi:hypothetical protein